MNEIKIITGKEEGQSVSTSIGALVEFYDAFNGNKMELMQKNWHQSSEASMSNPLGEIKRGWKEIREVYDKIFNGPAKVYVEYYDFQIYENGNFFQAVGREKGFLSLGDTEIDLKIRTSRTFVKDGYRFKQLHHHGSIEYPEILDKYQSAVRNGK